jgi:long-subunit fatty acid transport protein
VFGIVGRFTEDDEPSKFTLGLGAWNTFGGRASYPKTGMPALDYTQDICFELNAAAAYHVSDRLSIGAVARLGVGLFSIESTMSPFDATMSASGVGAALGVGALLRPTDNVRIGLNWRSPMRITAKGTAAVTLSPGNTDRPEIEHDQNWPQQVQLGVGVARSPRFKLATQIDWSQWSQLDTIEVRFPNGDLPDQIYPEYWEDNWSLRLGGELAVSQTLQLRAGTYYDTPAVPDQSLERQYSDAHKLGVAVGAGVRAGQWRIDFSADGVIPRMRTVPDNRQDAAGVGALVNKAPGEYLGSLITFELAAARTF